MSNTEEITNGDQKIINENKLLQNSDKNISDLQYNSNNDYNHVLSDQGDINENINMKSNKKTNHSVSTTQNEDRQNIKNSSKQTKRNEVITEPEADHAPQKDTTISHPRSVFTYTAEHEIPTFLHQDQTISAVPNMNDIHQTYLREQNSSSNTSIQDNMINMNGSYQYGPDYRKDHIGDYQNMNKAYDFEPRSQSADMLDHNIDKTLSLNDYGTTYIPLTGSSSDYSCSIDLGPRYHSPRGNGCDSDSMDYINYRLSNTSISDYTSNYRNLSFKDSDYMLNKKSSKDKISANTVPWRSSTRINQKIIPQMSLSTPMIPPIGATIPVMNYYNHPDEITTHYTNIENWRDHDVVEPGTGGAMVTPHGTITLRLHDRVRVDLTLDRAIRIVNFKNNIVVSVSATGSASGLLHPNGRVYQYGSRVEILAHDQHSRNNKYAKMWYKGVSFTSDQCALVYLVDSAGTRTTTDTFSDLSQDFSLSIFYNESRHGPQFVQEALNVLQTTQYWVTEDGTENWIINNIRISQTADGLVRIGRNSNKFSLRTSPANGSATVSTPYVHCTGSMGQTSHLFVRRGERRMHYDGASFIVRNAGHSAGFDDKHQLKVY